MDKREFDILYMHENLVVNCRTQELADEFLSLANSFDYLWCCEKDNWNIYEEETCYDVKKGMFGGKGYFESKGYKVVAYNGKYALVTW